jgi:hypothetical protein
MESLVVRGVSVSRTAVDREESIVDWVVMSRGELGFERGV